MSQPPAIPHPTLTNDISPVNHESPPKAQKVFYLAQKVCMNGKCLFYETLYSYRTSKLILSNPIKYKYIWVAHETHVHLTVPVPPRMMVGLTRVLMVDHSPFSFLRNRTTFYITEMRYFVFGRRFMHQHSALTKFKQE
jgi:hypothetical protein